ncbi:hypothetical protein Tco_1438553 [Tanacetum coccineum]
MQSSSVSSDFIEKLLNFENVSPTDNEIASLMDTIVRHEEPSDQTSILFTVPITVILTTIPLPPHLFNPLPQQATPTPTPETSKAMTLFPALLDFSSIFKFNDRFTKLETDLSDVKQVDQYAQAISSIPAIVDHYINNKLRKILLDKMKESKSHLRAVYKRELYDALVNSYNTDNDLFNTYGGRKSSKEAESFRDPKSKESKSTSSSKCTSRSYHNSSDKSARAEDPSHTVDDFGVQKNQEFDMGNNDEQPDNEAASKND